MYTNKPNIGLSFFGLIHVINLLIITSILLIGNKSMTKAEKIEVLSDKNQVFITFNQPVGKKSVENSFQISPKLTPNFSWINNKVMITFSEPFAPNTKYTLSVQDAVTENFDNFLSFSKTFKTPTEKIIFISTENNNAQLALYDLNKKSKKLLTTPDLYVIDFKLSKKHNTIYFFAISANESDFINKKLYSYNLKSEKTRLIIDKTDKNMLFSFDLNKNGDFLILKFANLNPNGTIANKQIMWTKIPKLKFKTLNFNSFTDREIIISPNNDAILGFNNSLGYTLFPLNPKSNFNNIYFSSYESVFGFNQLGTKLAFSDIFGLDEQSNFIVLYLDKNEKIEIHKNTGHFYENLQFLTDTTLIYTVKEDMVNHLETHNYFTQETTRHPIDNLNLEYFDLNSNSSSLIVESYPSLVTQNYGTSLRTMHEEFTGRLIGSTLLYLNLKNLNHQLLPLTGRLPVFY